MINSMTPAEIMDTAFDVLRENIKTIVLYAIGFGIVAFILTMLIMIVTMIFAFVSSFVGEVFLTVTMIILGSLILAVLISIYISFGVGIIRITAQKFLNYSIYASELIKGSLKSVFKIFKILIIGLMISIPFIIATFVIIVYLLFPMLEGLYYSTPATLGVSQVLAVILGIILAVLILFLTTAYFTCYCFTLHAAFIEKKSAIDSIKRSFKLVSSNFKRIYGYFILFSIIVTAINISLQGIITLLTGIIFLIMQLLNIEIDYLNFMQSAYTYTRLPYNILNWLVISPISAIMLTVLYFKQRSKFEGYDIILRLKRLKNETAGE